jgi:seryl-tRNA synthetase
MAAFREASPDQAQLLEALVAAGLLIESGVPGVYGRGAGFEAIRTAFDELVTRTAAPEHAEPMRFGPLLPRRRLEATGYLGSFPHLAGSVFGFQGSEKDAALQFERASRHEDWSEFQVMTELALTPAVCYPVYPAIAARGSLPAGGVTVDPGAGHVFRHEPSGDPARLQSFHMRELVRIGEPGAVLAWRDGWIERGRELLERLGLDVRSDVAADPFFGRRGRMLALSQVDQALKFELHVPIAGEEPTAVASFNYHQDHFGALYGIELAGGEVAHTACLGFGHERIVLALVRAHGTDHGAWPAGVREALWG